MGDRPHDKTLGCRIRHRQYLDWQPNFPESLFSSCTYFGGHELGSAVDTELAGSGWALSHVRWFMIGVRHYLTAPLSGDIIAVFQ